MTEMITAEEWRAYCEWTETTAVYPQERAREYLALGLVGELGEVANLMKKEIRNGDDLRCAITDELGDVLWYVAQLEQTQVHPDHRSHPHLIFKERRACGANSRNKNFVMMLDDAVYTLESMYRFEGVHHRTLGGMRNQALTWINDYYDLPAILAANRSKLEARKRSGELKAHE